MPTAMPTLSTAAPLPLRPALLLDATASGAMGLLFLVARGPLASALVLPSGLLFWSGLFLVPFAGFLVWVSRQVPVSRPIVLAIVLGNLAWTIASVAIVVSGLIAPNTLGLAFVLGQAAAVAMFAALEMSGVRRLAPAAA